MAYDFDLFVIGAGSGGVRASRMAAASGIKVAVAEDGMMGGTCVNVGCVPKKLFTYASNYATAFKDSAGYGWDKTPASFDWNTLIQNKDTEIKRLNGIYNTMLENSGVTVINGRAKFMDSNTVSVNGKTYTAQRILIACGSTPFQPAIQGIEHTGTSYDAFYLPKFPKTVTVLGGGYIAVEFASIFKGLGAEVNLILRKDTVLTGFDKSTAEFLQKQMDVAGVNIIHSTQVEKITKDGDIVTCHTNTGQAIESDFVLSALGRVPFSKDLGLENTTVTTNADGSVIVNDSFQTQDSSVYALGDVINRMQLTPVALKEAMVFLNHTYGDASQSVQYDTIPTAVFSYPNVGTCGLGEEQAVEKGYDITVYESEFRPMKNTLSGNPIRAYMKIIVDKKTDKVIGCHMVGDDAGEIMQGIGIAITAGLTKSDFDATIGIHPTSAEEFCTMRTPRA